MAKRKPSKSLKAEITELAAVVEESQTCAACGKAMKADAATCPHCGTPAREGEELHEKAEESLMDLEKHLADTGDAPAPEGPIHEPPAKLGLVSAADVVAAVEAPEPAPDRGPVPAPVVQAIVEVVPEPSPEVEVGQEQELEGFIEDIEAEVGPGEREPRNAPKAGPAVRKSTVRAVHTTATASRSSRWVAPVAAGLVIYVLALFLIALLGRFVVASFMIVGTFLVFAGIRARPGPSEGGRVGGPARMMEYVCPLCGTEIPARASQCPTCGAVFEE